MANSNYGIHQQSSGDHLEYLCLHHKKMQAKWLSTWNVRVCKGNYKI